MTSKDISYAALLAATAAFAIHAPAFAQTPAVAFDIPAGDLTASLNAFARQAGVQIFFPSAELSGRKAPAIKGVMPAHAALSRLLSAGDLEIAADDGRTISLRPARRETAIALDEILVTAQKREQKTIDIPFALTAYSGKALERLGVTNFRELATHVPGLMVEDQSPNNPIFVMRGITSSGGDSFTEPRVSVFQDGVSISKSRGSYIELYDNARVEVAKGPQSTLFGRGALIGALNVIQNKAGPDLDWSLAAEGGDLGYYQIDGMLNLPLSDTVSLRVAGRRKSRDGYQKNLDPNADGDLNAIDTNAYRIALSFKPNDRFSADLIYNHQDDETNGTGFKSMYVSPTDPATGKVLAGTRLNDPVWLSKPADFAPRHHLGVDQRQNGVMALAKYKVTNALTLNATTSYRDIDAAEVYDADGTSLPLFTNMEDVGGTQFSQELRLNYDNGGRVSWFAGANYYRERSKARVDVRFDERMLLAQASGMLNGGPFTGLPKTTPAPAALFDNTAFTGALLQGLVAQSSKGNLVLTSAEASALAARLDPHHVETSRNESDLDSYDLFGDMTFHVTDRLELSGGLRYSRDEKTTIWGSSVQGRSILGGAIGAAGIAAAGTPTAVATARALIQGMTAYGATLNGPLPLFGVSAQPTAHNGDLTGRDLNDDGVTWRLTGRYALSPIANVYASYSRGRRPAVLSAGAPGAPDGTPTFAVAPAETAQAYEAGIKADLLDRRLRVDASLYSYDYDNFQTREQRGSTFVTTNAGTARAYGFEGQADFAATPDFDLFATYAYNHARFTRGAYEGNHFARSPDHMVSLGASMRWTGLGGKFDLRPTYAWRSKIFFADDNDRPELQAGLLVPDAGQDEFQNGFGLLNVRISYAPDRGNWEVEAFGSNLTDEIYRKGAGSAGKSIGLPTNVLGEPRVYGLRLTIHR